MVSAALEFCLLETKIQGGFHWHSRFLRIVFSQDFVAIATHLLLVSSHNWAASAFWVFFLLFFPLCELSQCPGAPLDAFWLPQPVQFWRANSWAVSACVLTLLRSFTCITACRKESTAQNKLSCFHPCQALTQALRCLFVLWQLSLPTGAGWEFAASLVTLWVHLFSGRGYFLVF